MLKDPYLGVCLEHKLPRNLANVSREPIDLVFDFADFADFALFVLSSLT